MSNAIMSTENNSQLQEADELEIKRMQESFLEIKKQLARKVIGQEEVIEQLLISFFAGGHTLLIGVPGLAKTLLVRSLAEVLGLDFNRIQFTPDLMPSDITGTDIISLKKDGSRDFNFLAGPLFTNIVLADEINRTPPKTQASLLEAMEEYTIHVGGNCYDVPEPFFVLATQNPIEQEGTYQLPAAALDRFMFNIFVDYPDDKTEKTIVEVTTSKTEEELDLVLDKTQIVKLLELVRRLPIKPELLEYAVAIARYSRPDDTQSEVVKEWMSWGASPRAAQALILGAKARAILHGRKEATAADIRAIAGPVLRHRMMPNFHAESEGVGTDDVIKEVLKEVPRPAGDVSPSDESKKIKRRKKFFLFRWLWEPETQQTQLERLLLEKELAPSKLSKIIQQEQKSRFARKPLVFAGVFIVLFSVLTFLTALNIFNKGEVDALSIWQFVLLAFGTGAGVAGVGAIFNKLKTTALVLMIPAVLGSVLAVAFSGLSSINVFCMAILSLMAFILLLLSPE